MRLTKSDIDTCRVLVQLVAMSLYTKKLVGTCAYCLSVLKTGLSECSYKKFKLEHSHGSARF